MTLKTKVFIYDCRMNSQIYYFQNSDNFVRNCVYFVIVTINIYIYLYFILQKCETHHELRKIKYSQNFQNYLYKTLHEAFNSLKVHY